MEFLTNTLKKVIPKLSEGQKEEIDVIESIINTNEANKEKTKENLFRFIEKHEIKNCINFILECIDHATKVRQKERESILFLLTSILNHFHLNFDIARYCIILRNMLEVKSILPPNKCTDKHIFDFAEEGTIGRAIFEDNIELLQHLLAAHPDEGKEQMFDIGHFFQSNYHLKRSKADRIEVAALFGSIKCFKYLMMNGDEIDEDTCKFAVSGGNLKIIHLCEQKGLQFEDCLFISSIYHQFEIFEWLNIHFHYNEIPLTEFIDCYNEPLFYFYSLSGSYVKTEAEDYNTPIHNASKHGQLEIVKYLYENWHANIETEDEDGFTPINYASANGHLEVVKYLYEKCHANIETKDNNEFSPINYASCYGHLDVVKYLYETCHANIETKDQFGNSPTNNASKNGHLEVGKYIYETFNKNIETNDD